MIRRVLATAAALLFLSAAPAEAGVQYEGPAWAFAKDWTPCPDDFVEGITRRCVWHARRHDTGPEASFILTGWGRMVFLRHHDATILLRPMYGGPGDQN